MANRYVLDASVVLKWFFTLESEALIAAQVRSDVALKKIKAYIPPYTLIEVLNVLSKKSPYRGATTYAWDEVRKLVFKSRIKTKRLRDKDLVRAFQIVSVHGITFYDALHLALAERLKAGFVTADYRASARLTTRTDVLELRNY